MSKAPSIVPSLSQKRAHAPHQPPPKEKQTNKQTNNQPNKQTNKQTTKQPNNQPTNQPTKQTNKQTNKQKNKQTQKINKQQHNSINKRQPRLVSQLLPTEARSLPVRVRGLGASCRICKVWRICCSSRRNAEIAGGREPLFGTRWACCGCSFQD